MENNNYKRIPQHKRIEAALRMRARFQKKESVCQISNDLGISRSQLYELEEKYIEDPTMADKPRTGAPLKVDKRFERRIVREIEKSPFEISSNVTVKVNSGMDEEEKVCSGTIRRVAIRNDLIARRPLAKPYLEERHIRLRLEFAEKYKDKTTRFWMNVIYMDESFLRSAHNDSRTRVRRHTGESAQPKYVIPKFKHEGQGVMFWGCVTWYGVGPLVPIEGPLTGTVYGNLLHNNIPLVAMNLMTASPYIIEDNPHVHNTPYCKTIKESLHLRSLELPPNSPDLNIIEPIWGIWKGKAAIRNPRNKEELTQVGVQEWGNITLEEIRTQIRSMPSRIAAVIKSHGGHTEY